MTSLSHKEHLLLIAFALSIHKSLVCLAKERILDYVKSKENKAGLRRQKFTTNEEDDHLLASIVYLIFVFYSVISVKIEKNWLKRHSFLTLSNFSFIATFYGHRWYNLQQ